MIDSYQVTEKYLGLQYAPLRKEFQNCYPKVIKEQVENLLLLSGGSDNYHILRTLLESIDFEEYQQLFYILEKSIFKSGYIPESTISLKV